MIALTDGFFAIHSKSTPQECMRICMSGQPVG